MAKVIGVGDATSANQTIHDPTCGSGSLLLKAHDEAKGRTGLDLALYGQEMDNATKALARMNMILHDCATAEIWQDNSLSSPHFKDADGRLKTFDFVVANPPFSTKAWSNGFHPEADEFKRFTFGSPPRKNGDYAFLLHVLACLKSTGKGAIILPHGVLFRGGAEATIRREIVKRGYIKGIIGLPANLFYGTGIPACIVVIDKENAHARKGIFMVDASEGFVKDGNKNRLRAQDIHRIVDTFTRQLEVPRYARMVSLSEISDAKNDFNLNLPRYIDCTEPEDLQDIDGHLRGGIPDRDIDALGRYWEVVSGVRPLLFESAGRPGYSRLKLLVGEVKAAIFGHAEFAALDRQLDELKEEHGGEGDLLEEVVDAKGKISKKAVGARLKDIEGDADFDDERKALENYSALLDQQAEAQNRLKTAKDSLEAKVAEKYGKLAEAEIKRLVVDDKWMARLAADVQSELDRISQMVTGRISQLADRYAASLPQLTDDVAALAARVDGYLKKMGAVWN
jgi:type I restriction-modification system DNA methylase subunit